MEPSPPPLNLPPDPTGQPYKPSLQVGDDSIAGKIAPACPHPGAAIGMLTPEHAVQIAAARKSSAKIRRACAVAKFSGVTTAVFAALTIVFSLTNLTGLALGVGMAIISIFEFRGVAELTRLDRTAPRRLAINQLAFATMLILYGVISYWNYLHGPSPLDSALGEAGSDPEIRQMVGDYSGMINNIMAAVYLGVIIAALIGPGLTAVYYYSRQRYIDDYVNKTPQWIQDLQRAGMSL